MKRQCTRCGQVAEIACEYSFGDEIKDFDDSLCGDYEHRICADCCKKLIHELECRAEAGAAKEGDEQG